MKRKDTTIIIMGKFIFIVIATLIAFQQIKFVNGRDAPPVMLPDQGTVLGTYMKMYRTQNVMAYLGIPYAQPPIGDKRFAPPVIDNLPNWSGVRNATFFQSDCWQNPKRRLKKHDEQFKKLVKLTRAKLIGNEEKPYDEDCLFLNIFIPDAPSPMEGYAVIVWLHSGDFSIGSPNEMDPFQLVFKQKVIVVTVAYRLNIFGFLTSQDGESPGNFGLMDQSAALLWIKKNIKLFGGNDNSITLMGHGSGSISVGLHLLSGEWSDGLFHKAIMMSGSPLAEYAVREPDTYSPTLDSVANAFGCFRRPTSKLLECLRRLDAQVLSENLPYFEWGPTIDDGLSNTTSSYIPESPKRLIEHGKLRKIPLLIGYTDMEEILDIITSDMMDKGISPQMYDTLLGDVISTDLAHLESNDSWCGNLQIVIDAVNYAYKPYPPVTDAMRLRKMYIDFHTERNYVAPSLYLAYHMSKNADTYVYRFDIKSRTQITRIDDEQDWIGVPHNYDLIFVWGMPYWLNNDMINVWNGTDKRVSDIIMTLWSNFAKFTDPTQTNVYIKWDRYEQNEQKILIIDRAFNMTSDMNFRSIQFWNDYYPKVVQHAAQCCNITDTANRLFLIKSTNYLQQYIMIGSIIFLINILSTTILLNNNFLNILIT